ncbi:type I polyketide synthase, partial [Sedimenticola sp.]|uniref:type I polyketide synthase n=1 Tax=Sedimenticola sp. TaxID=1940285 RepID=UPI003D147A4E
MEHGPAYRAVTEVFVGEGEVLAKLMLPSSVSDSQAAFGLHPSLLDAALQAAMGLSDDALSTPALPYALESLSFFAPCPETLWAWVRVQDGVSDSLQKLDIELCDETGRVCVRLHGFSSRMLEGGLATTVRRGTLMAQPVWEAAALAYPANAVAYAAHHVFLCGVRTAPVEVQTQLPESMVTTLAEPLTLELTQDFNDAALRVFTTVQRHMKAKSQRPVLIQVVVSTQGPAGLYSALLGLLRTARLENPHLIGQIIALEAEASVKTVVECLQVEARQPGVDHIRYENGRRLIARFAEIANVSAPVDHSPWRSGGVYLVTGGAGGLGLIVAKAIAEQVVGPRLILTGRSPLDEAKQHQLERLRALGAKVAYRQVDVTDPSAVAELIESIQTDWGRLSGIVHSAGVIDDAFIVKKTSAAFACVLAPKVTGTLNLDKATQGMDLDVFILFSSMAGVLGNVGQADYATGNAFLDAFAHYRNGLVAVGQRRGQTVSINWPLWAEGGMGVDAVSEERMRSTLGLDPLETGAGIEALHQSLVSGASQVVVVKGDLRRLYALLEGQNEPETVPVLDRLPADEESFATRVTDYLIRQVAGVLKLPTHRIDAQAPLEKYGIDSIMVMQLTSELEKRFGPLSKTLFFEYQTLQELSQYFLE